MIDHQHKIIFLHIPRTGGHYISEKLGAYIVKESRHVQPSFYLQEYKKEWNEYYKFSFVRNPWDRIVSSWSRTIAKGSNWFDYKKIDKDKYFNGAILTRFKPFIIKNKFWMQVHFKPQIKWLHPSLDFIGKYENLDDDLKKVFNDNSIEWSNRGNFYKSYHRPYQEYYTPETKHIVQTVYKEEIKRFGYTFD